MNTSIKQVALIVVALFSAASPLYAQRDAGAKARGDMRGFWESDSRPRSYSPSIGETRRSYSYAPQVDVRQSYTYEPSSFDAGDRVVVSVDQTNLMRGAEALARIERGQAIEILKVQGPWLGTQIEVNGQKIGGWVWHRHVAAAAEDVDGGETGVRPEAPIERRSFSYEPAERSYVQPREQSSRRRMTSPIERRLRPGTGLWE